MALGAKKSFVCDGDLTIELKKIKLAIEKYCNKVKERGVLICIRGLPLFFEVDWVMLLAMGDWLCGPRNHQWHNRDTSTDLKIYIISIEILLKNDMTGNSIREWGC